MLPSGLSPQQWSPPTVTALKMPSGGGSLTPPDPQHTMWPLSHNAHEKPWPLSMALRLPSGALSGQPPHALMALVAFSSVQTGWYRRVAARRS